MNKISKFHKMNCKVMFDGSDAHIDDKGTIHAPLFVSAFLKDMFVVPKIA